MAIGQDKARLVVILEQSFEKEVIDWAKKEKRSKSSMAAILIEEALQNRQKK